MSENDTPVVQRLCDGLAEHAIACYVAERDEQYGKSLPAKVEEAIQRSDCLLILWTKDGSQSAFVNQEVGYAKALGRLCVPLVEEGVAFKGFDIDKEFVSFNRSNAPEAILKLGKYLSNLKIQKEIEADVARRRRNLIGVIAALGLGYLILSDEE